MSWLKFWGKKTKGKDIKEEYQKEFKRDDGEGQGQTDSEREKNRLKHSLSISRSGRFKSKKRERSGILDKPELFNDTENTGHFSYDGTTAASQQQTYSPESSRSQNSSFNDMRQMQGYGLPPGRNTRPTAAV